jgi:OmpA-OmpF porin, OOP family
MRSISQRALGTINLTVLVGLGFSLASTSPAWGEDIDLAAAPAGGPREYRFEFGMYGGGHFFADKHGLREFDSDPPNLSPRDGAAIGARLTMNFNPWVSIEGDAWWTPTETRSAETRMSIFGYRGSLVITLVGSGPFRPFLNLGVGGLTSIVDDENVLPSDQDPVVHAGLGAKIFFGERAGLRLEGNIMAPPAFASPAFKVGSETAFGGPDFQALASLFFNFGEVEKSSRQVIVKKETVMMQAAAPPPPSPPTPTDPDGDGIAGDADKCPLVAEDRDGFQDDDGCPDPDNDGDGIPDAQDKCPNQPETFNGIDDEDGCPEVDTDGDGFLGSRDKCPDAPETFNGYQDHDGCPDEIPQAVKKFTGVIEGINFKTGSADILPGSFGILDRAVEVLKEYPDIKMEIQGHTDNRGKADFNRDLSQRRADAVRTYFTSRGIAAERLTAVGYGMDRPIADNRSESGRSRNRRTEFRLIGVGQ